MCSQNSIEFFPLIVMLLWMGSVFAHPGKACMRGVGVRCGGSPIAHEVAVTCSARVIAWPVLLLRPRPVLQAVLRGSRQAQHWYEVCACGWGDCAPVDTRVPPGFKKCVNALYGLVGICVLGFANTIAAQYFGFDAIGTYMPF